MRRFVKLMLGFAMVSGLALTGFGCKGLSQEQAQAIRPVALEYWTTFEDVDAIQKLVADYRALRPYISVNIRQLGPDEFYPRLIDALADDQGPDIISVNNRSFGKYVSKLTPMPASVRDTTVRVIKGTVRTETIVNTNEVPLPTVEQVDREYVQAVKQDVIRGGQVYGLPLSLDTMAVYYNKDLLDRAGVPEPPKTWEEFQVAVKKITRIDARSGRILQAGTALGTGNNIPGSDDILYILFRQSSVPFVDRSGRAVFGVRPSGYDGQNETAAMTVMNFYTDFANNTRDTYTWNESMANSLEAFVNGSVGFFFGYRYHYPIIKTRAPQLNFSIMPMLQLVPENPVNVANYSINSVLSKSEYQNEAWAFINYLTHSQATKEYLALSKRPTALRAYIGEQLADTEMSPFVSQVLVADSWYRGRDFDGAKRALADMLREWLFIPENPDQIMRYRSEVLERAAAKINQTL